MRTVLLMLICLACRAQGDSIYIKRVVDGMSDLVYHLPSKKLVVANEKQTIGLSVDININNDVQPMDFLCKMYGLGECCENNELIVMFEDSSKVKMASFNEYNCKGIAYFRIQDPLGFINKRAIKVRITNGMTSKSFTTEIPESQRDYFRQVFYACKINKVRN